MAILRGTIAAGLASLWLTAWSVPAATASGPPSGTGARVAFSLAAQPQRKGPGRTPLSLSLPLPQAGNWDREGEAALEDAVSQPRAKKLRGWIELGVFSVATTAIFWAGYSFPEDRDFKITFHDQFRRLVLLEGWRFDSNPFSFNWFHVISGAAYYQQGRASDLSWLYSWMMAVAGSTWWEIIAEADEVIAINDQINAGLGGFAVGEPWYQIGHYLGHQHGFFQRALSFLNPIVKLNHWLDRKDPSAKYYVQPGWRDLSLFVGARRLAPAGLEARTDTYFGFHARLLGLPEYGMPGEVRRTVKDVYFSEITLDYATRHGHVEETRFFTKAVAWGRFVQRIADDRTGYSLTWGLGSAFELFKKRPLADYDAHPVPVKTDLEQLHLDEPRNFTDKLGILHLAGPVLDWTVFRRDLRLRTVVEAYGDFAMVNSTAIHDYSLFHDITGLKTIVFYYGYFYGFGGSFSASASLDYRNFRARGQAELGAWGSVDVLDRFQDEVTNNAHLTDSRTRFLLGVGWKMPGAPLELFADIESVRRWGRLEEIRSHRLETKAFAGLAFSF